LSGHAAELLAFSLPGKCNRARRLWNSQTPRRLPRFEYLVNDPTCAWTPIMTTTIARQQPSTPSGQAADSGTAGTNDPVPVLIRLPDLSEALASAETSQVSPTAERNLKFQTPLAPATPPSATAAVVHRPDEARNTIVDASIPEQDGQSTPAKSPAMASGVAAPWSRFPVPRPVVHTAVAVGLLGILILAYLAIVGGGDSSREVAGDKPAGIDALDSSFTHDHSTVHEDESPDAHGAPLLPAESQKATSSPPSAATAVELSDLEAPAASTTDVKDKEEIEAPSFPEPPVENPPAAADRSLQEPEQGADEPGDVRQPGIPFGPPQEDLPEAPAAADFANSGSVDQPSAGSYPVTNPATFQYPADYHERLGFQTEASPGQPSSPRTDGSGDYGWQPSTARLQPRIDPPPIR
jgi:hypothetical protein